eukprot:scaffold95256_cov31-Tisochrysis_lutea.AAC.1
MTYRPSSPPRPGGAQQRSTIFTSREFPHNSERRPTVDPIATRWHRAPVQRSFLDDRACRLCAPVQPLVPLHMWGGKKLCRLFVGGALRTQLSQHMRDFSQPMLGTAWI